jgi:hypothetical protein
MSAPYWYSLYAVPQGSIDSVSNSIFGKLGLSFRPVGSGAWGYYTISGHYGESEVVSVYSNQNMDDGERYLNAPSVPDHPVLIVVYDTKRHGEIHDYITSELGGVAVESERDRPPNPKPFHD